MNEEKQRIAIAEICGWSDIQRENSGEFGGLRGIKLNSDRMIVPSYCRDLNAMHEAKLTMNRFQCHDFNNELSNTITERPDTGNQSLRWTWGATAAQEAEAFLRVHHKWQD